MRVMIARMLNEERFIKRFIEQYYPLVDKFLIADGGSTDNSVKIALQYEKVSVRLYSMRVPCPKDETKWMNPESDHFNFVHDWAKSLDPEWIFYDDVDCAPNYLLKKHGRAIFDNIGPFFNEVLIHRLYIWGEDRYFPKLNEPGYSMWAWKPSSHTSYYANTEDPQQIDFVGYPNSTEDKAHKFHLHQPLCLLHRCWPDRKYINQKMKRYASWGKPQIYPTKSKDNGKLEKLPEWAIE